MPVAAEKQAFGAKEQDTVPSPAAVTEPDDPKEQSGDVFEAEDDIQSPLVYKPQGCAQPVLQTSSTNYLLSLLYRKMFVGGISWQTSRGKYLHGSSTSSSNLLVGDHFVTLRLVCYVEAMKNLFEKYGEVLECQIIQDPVTKRSRLVVIL